MPSCFADESVSIPEVQQQFYRTAHAHKFVMVSDWQKNKGLPKQKNTTLKGDMEAVYILKHILMLHPALALVSINMTPRSIKTCLFHEMQQNSARI